MSLSPMRYMHANKAKHILETDYSNAFVIVRARRLWCAMQKDSARNKNRRKPMGMNAVCWSPFASHALYVFIEMKFMILFDVK